jgi:hypothetical protein
MIIIWVSGVTGLSISDINSHFESNVTAMNLVPWGLGGRVGRTRNYIHQL